MYSLLDSTILVSCSKPSRNQFARFDPNRFYFGKWNEKSDESETNFDLGLTVRIRLQDYGEHANQALDDLKQLLDHDGNALITKQLCNDSEVRGADESRVQRVDNVVAVAQTLSRAKTQTLRIQLRYAGDHCENGKTIENGRLELRTASCMAEGQSPCMWARAAA